MLRLATAAAGRASRTDLHLAGARAMPGVVYRVDAHGHAVRPVPVGGAGSEAVTADHSRPGVAARGPVRQGKRTEMIARPRRLLSPLFRCTVDCLAAGLSRVDRSGGGIGILTYHRVASWNGREPAPTWNV